jgi:UDP-N-acetylmuramoylalanine--D-glutamate ligase
MIPVTPFTDRPVAVLGLGRSGLASAEALALGGTTVWAWDDDKDARTRAADAGVSVVDLAGCDWGDLASLILSPGIPHTHPAPHPIAAAARAAGTEIIGDIELLGRSRKDAARIGITGTNGKSTTTALVGHVLQAAGKDAQIGGNLGEPALSLAPLSTGGIYVLEMSSYQLELTVSVTFDVAVLLNISPDHLDRHGGMEGYVAAKRLIFRRQTAADTAIVGVDDADSHAIHDDLAGAGDCVVIPVSAEGAVAGGVFVVDGILIDDMDGARESVLDLRQIVTLPGRHNWQNTAAAYAAARAAGVARDDIAATIRTYPGLAHRQERIAVVDGIAYINDSKATNADAASRALTCYDCIFWIAGGQAKEGGLTAVEPHLGQVRRAFLIGEAADAFAETLAGRVEVHVSGDLASAVADARRAALDETRAGAVVLLSPACASFDQFTDFEARGEAFRDLVAELPGRRDAECIS